MAMDRYYEVVSSKYRCDRFAPDPVTAIAFGVQLGQLVVELINKLRRYLRSMKRCKKECEALQDLLASIQRDVETTANTLENCKRLRVETSPQETWLCRLETELLYTEKLIDKCAPSGVFTNRPGDELPTKISAQMETLKRFAGELPQVHGVLTNLQMTREAQAVVGTRHADEFVPHRYETRPYSFRRMPSFGNYRNHDAEFLSDGIRYELRPYPFRCMPSFGNYRNHDAEFVSDRIDYESRPYSSFRRMPWFGSCRNHDADIVFMHGVYFPEARWDYCVAQPIVFTSHASFGSVPVMNPCYLKHIDSEYY